MNDFIFLKKNNFFFSHREHETKADVIGLSGLITPSLDEMVNVATEMQRQGFTGPKKKTPSNCFGTNVTLLTRFFFCSAIANRRGYDLQNPHSGEDSPTL